MRALLYLLLFLLLYHAVKTIFRFAVISYRSDDGRSGPGGSGGHDMVQDPECRTYILKERAVARRIGGSTAYFCSAACADAHAKRRLP